jgi:hypothetical protein
MTDIESRAKYFSTYPWIMKHIYTTGLCAPSEQKAFLIRGWQLKVYRDGDVMAILLGKHREENMELLVLSTLDRARDEISIFISPLAN